MTALIAIPRLPEAVDEDGTHAPLPEMPALTRLLRRARPLPGAPDWQAGVMQAVGLGSLPAAVAAAAAIPALAAGSDVCFAAPLHAVAGISRVHLPPEGWLALEAGEEAAWREAFNEEFAAAGATLHAAGEDGWILAASFAGGASDAAPELLAGAALERAPARGESQRALRRLGTEVEMWLASHPLNRRRERRGDLALNTIWFWGAARSQALPASAPLRGIVSGRRADAWLAGLAAWAGRPVVRAGGWDAAVQAAPGLLPAQTDDGGLVLAVPESQAAGSCAGYWQELEQRWFAPAEQALADGAIDRLQLQLGGAAWQVQRNSLRHWLRWGRRPWWQMGAQA